MTPAAARSISAADLIFDEGTYSCPVWAAVTLRRSMGFSIFEAGSEAPAAPDECGKIEESGAGKNFVLLSLT
jgi:hypothetical protein